MITYLLNGFYRPSPVYFESLALGERQLIRRPFCSFISILLLCLFCASSPSQSESKTEFEPDNLKSHISLLIEQLNNPNYPTRLRAQAELEKIGVLALDQLHAASFHPDPQIASTARFIVQSNQFSWSWDTDPVSVRQILTNYGAADSEKSMYIDQLQRLEHDEGFAALCRLARYETRSGLAKRAALLLMRSKPTVGQTWEIRKEALHNYINGGQSQATRWLVKYAANETEFDLKWWEQTLKDELQLLKSGSIDTNLELVIDLHKWVAEQTFDKPAYRTFAVAIARSILSLGKTVATLDSPIGNRSTRTNEFAQWALKFKLPEIVQEQHAKLPLDIVSREFLFGYILAESYLLQDNKELANVIAQHSLNQVACNELGVPINSNAEAEPPVKGLIEFPKKTNTFEQDRRSNLGRKLEERGQFDWAEAEFRLVINDDLTNRLTQDGMTLLGQMLQIQGKHSEAADVLDPFVTRFNNEPMFKKQLTESYVNPNVTISNYHLYVADAARQAGDFDKAARNYWLSIELEQENVDAVIGLYRLPLSESESTRRRSVLVKIIASLRTRIREGEELRKKSNSGDHASYSLWLANCCNTLAWVIANTEGNKEEALSLSRKACMLSPEHAEYLDTLAYCYAAMDRYQDAVQQQRRAVDLKPHHPELVKALQRFEAKLRSSPQSAPK